MRIGDPKNTTLSLLENRAADIRAQISSLKSDVDRLNANIRKLQDEHTGILQSIDLIQEASNNGR